MRKRRARAIGLAAGLVIYLAPGAYAFWGPAKRLTWTSGFSQCPSIAADSSGGIQIVWQDDPRSALRRFITKGAQTAAPLGARPTERPASVGRVDRSRS